MRQGVPPTAFMRRNLYLGTVFIWLWNCNWDSHSTPRNFNEVPINCCHTRVGFQKLCFYWKCNLITSKKHFIVALHQNFSILKLLKLNSHETNSLMLVPTSLMHLKVVIQILEKLFLKLFLGSGHLISWEIMERDFQGWIVPIVIKSSSLILRLCLII